MTINQSAVPSQLSAPSDFVIGKHRDAGRSGKNNEDWHDVFATYVQEGGRSLPVQIMVVADGIGGNVAGERASKLACDTIKTVMTSSEHYPVAISTRMEKAIHAANRAIYTEANADTTLKGMGTTVVMAALVRHGLTADLFVAHAGDSRAYLIRAGHAHQLTRDHTWAQEAVEAGYLSPERAASHPNRSVIKRYLGILESVEVDHAMIMPRTVGAPAATPLLSVDPFPFQPGDTLLICTDGLTDVVSDEQIQTTVTQYTPQKAAEKLIALANEAGGPDNITAVLVQWSTARRRGGWPRLPMAVAAALLLVLLGWAGFSLGPQLSEAIGNRGAATQVNGAMTRATITATPTLSTTAIISDSAPVVVAFQTMPATATPTAAPTMEPTATGLPPTATPSATFTPTYTPTPTATSTPAPVTKTPTELPTATPTVETANSPTTPDAFPYQIITPFAGGNLKGEIKIAWQGSSPQLGEDEKIDVVQWIKGKGRVETGAGFVDVNAVAGNSITVNLDELGLQSGESYEYAVVVVEVEPHWRVVKLVSNIDSFRYQPNQNQGDDSCTGPTCRP